MVILVCIQAASHISQEDNKAPLPKSTCGLAPRRITSSTVQWPGNHTV
jgi:hypothetical protein